MRFNIICVGTPDKILNGNYILFSTMAYYVLLTDAHTVINARSIWLVMQFPNNDTLYDFFARRTFGQSLWNHVWWKKDERRNGLPVLKEKKIILKKKNWQFSNTTFSWLLLLVLLLLLPPVWLFLLLLFFVFFFLPFYSWIYFIFFFFFCYIQITHFVQYVYRLFATRVCGLLKIKYSRKKKKFKYNCCFLIFEWIF